MSINMKNPETAVEKIDAASNHVAQVRLALMTGDNFTRIPWRNKPADQCPDGPRYKAIGNSMATNCMEWLGLRIELAEKLFA